MEDIDSGNNSVINFRIVGGAVGSYWNVDQDTGVMSAVKTLDKEGSPKTWGLTVEAYEPLV